MSHDAGSRGSYGNRHRAFLQALLARQTITFEEAKPLIAAIESACDADRPMLAEDVSQETLEDYIERVNHAISSFDLEIRNSSHQVKRTRIYALVNTTSDAITQMATVHSADEIAFVKRVLDAMFETYNTPRAEIMAVTGMQALELAKLPNRRQSNFQTQPQQGAQATALTKTEAQKVLQSLVDAGWFEVSQAGYYSLSPRSLMELRDWLVRTYNDEEDPEDDENEAQVRIKFCHACRDVVTVGQRCPDTSCNARMHTNCLPNVFRAQRNQEICPLCKTDWKDAPSVGESAARKAGGSSGANGRRSSAMVTDEASDDDDEE